MAKVKMNDREDSVEQLRVACSIVDMSISYTILDLVLKLKKDVDTNKSDIKTVLNIHKEWAAKWVKYFKEQE